MDARGIDEGRHLGNNIAQRSHIQLASFRRRFVRRLFLVRTLDTPEQQQKVQISALEILQFAQTENIVQ